MSDFTDKDLISVNAAELALFRRLARELGVIDEGWQWIGPFMSQRMFGISEKRARDYAARYGGEASKMPSEKK